MTTEEHDALRESLAVYALDQLRPAEGTAVAAHLESCQECRAELGSLLNVVAAVRSAAQSGELDLQSPVVEPPSDLSGRIVERIRGAAPDRHPDTPVERRMPPVSLRDLLRRRSARLVLGAAVAVVLVALGVALGTRLAQPAGPPYELIAFGTQPAGVQASGKLIAHTWGTEANLVISGLNEGELYRVAFVTADGRDVPGGTFIGVAGRPILCNVNAAVLRDQAIMLRIFDASNEPVLEADLRS